MRKNSLFIQSLFTLFLLAVASPFTMAQDRASLFDRLQKDHTLRCAYISWSKSYFAKDPNTGNFTGLGYDMAEALAKTMGFKIQWTEEVSLANMFEGFKTGRYDAICTPVFQDPSSGSLASFTRPVYYAPLYAYARADDARFDAKAADAIERINKPDIKVVDVDGTNAQEIHKNRYPKAQMVYLPNMTGATDLISNVLTGKADITQQNPIMIDDFFKTQPGKLKQASGPLMIYPLSIILLPQGEYAARDWFDLGIESMINVGKVENLLNQYDPENKFYRRLKTPYQ